MKALRLQRLRKGEEIARLEELGINVAEKFFSAVGEDVNNELRAIFARLGQKIRNSSSVRWLESSNGGLGCECLI